MLSLKAVSQSFDKILEILVAYCANGSQVRIWTLLDLTMGIGLFRPDPADLACRSRCKARPHNRYEPRSSRRFSTGEDPVALECSEDCI